jgi:hypothetical protein
MTTIHDRAVAVDVDLVETVADLLSFFEDWLRNAGWDTIDGLAEFCNWCDERDTALPLFLRDLGDHVVVLRGIVKAASA